MNPEIKQRWITALRSSGNTTSKEVLIEISVDTYCCLGVQCSAAVAKSTKRINPMDWLVRLLDYLFGCSHPKTTFPQTIRAGGTKRTYIVCLDCGREWDYAWPS